MPKLNKLNFARGVKLSSQHISVNLDEVGLAVSDFYLDRDNLAEPKVPFYVNFTFAGFKNNALGFSNPTQKQNGMNANLVFPVPLIPTQDNFSSKGDLNSDVPIYVLDSVSVALDLRGEGAAMRYDPAAAPYPTPATKRWKLNYELAQEQDIELSLLQKDYTFFNENQTFPNNSIFTTTIPATIAFAGSESRVENPYYIYGINKQINPYKSYYLAFSVPNQFDEEFFMSNLTISFKFYTLLDTDQEGQTNQPNTQTKTNYNLNLIPPASYSVISADSATGLQTNLQKIDNAFQEKMTAGLGDKFGNLGTFEEDGDLNKQMFRMPAIYDVIVVPMWQGTYGNSGLMTTAGTFTEGSDITQGAINPANYPPAGQRLYRGPIQDIRTIPLFYPFAIHQVLCWHNEQSRTGDGYQTFGNGSISGFVSGKVGVGLGSCFQSDIYTYEQVAYHLYTNAWENTIDKITLRDNVFNRQGDFGVNFPRTAGHLMQVPITPNSPNGQGFYPQGSPVYCGGGTKRMENRPQAFSTNGMENFIEIRWEFNSANGWVDFTEEDPPETPQVIAGLGGHFVYLIGKKLLTTNRNNLQE